MTTPIPQFVTREVDQSNAPQTVKSITRAELLLCNLVDGEGKEKTRLVVITPNAKLDDGKPAVFMFNETINGKLIATAATSWAREGILDQVSHSKGGTKEIREA